MLDYGNLGLGPWLELGLGRGLVEKGSIYYRVLVFLFFDYFGIQGFNCSLFAYGQTGSGKSYSVIGFDSSYCYHYHHFSYQYYYLIRY